MARKHEDFDLFEAVVAARQQAKSLPPELVAAFDPSPVIHIQLRGKESPAEPTAGPVADVKQDR